MGCELVRWVVAMNLKHVIITYFELFDIAIGYTNGAVAVVLFKMEHSAVVYQARP